MKVCKNNMWYMGGYVVAVITAITLQIKMIGMVVVFEQMVHQRQKWPYIGLSQSE